MNMNKTNLAAQSQQFIDHLEQWMNDLRPASLSSMIPEPQKAALTAVDLTNGFCNEGPLASPRVKSIVKPSADLMQISWDYGIYHMFFTKDTHEPDAPEFQSFPPHCVRGTEESEPVDEIKNLAFFDQIHVLPKNSISSSHNTPLLDWMAHNTAVETVIVIGDCTDLCTYQLAMDLKLHANAHQKKRHIIVPADCVQTYDLPVAVAREVGAMPHAGDLLHAVFLYHMALNGIEVVRSLTP
jgi:nicotinamidase-related amidase